MLWIMMLMSAHLLTGNMRQLNSVNQHLAKIH